MGRKYLANRGYIPQKLIGTLTLSMRARLSRAGLNGRETSTARRFHRMVIHLLPARITVSRGIQSPPKSARMVGQAATLRIPHSLRDTSRRGSEAAPSYGLIHQSTNPLIHCSADSIFLCLLSFVAADIYPGIRVH